MLLLGKAPLLCIRFVLPQLCPQGSPKAGLAWAASSPARAVHRAEPFVSHLRWARVQTRPLRDNVIICVVLPEVPPCHEALDCGACAHVWVLGVGGGGSPSAGTPTHPQICFHPFARADCAQGNSESTTCARDRHPLQGEQYWHWLPLGQGDTSPDLEICQEEGGPDASNLLGQGKELVFPLA